MVRAKKMKGKQRKAAKAKKESDAIVRITTGISKADNDATLSFVIPSLKGSTEDFEQTKGGSIFMEVLPTVLNFLNRCEYQTFDQVLFSVGGDLRRPATWIEVLLIGAVHVESCNKQIAENIGPLVRCMCNDMERTFFKSSEYWKEGILPFVQLISVIVTYSVVDKIDTIIDELFKYDGLLSSVVQWAFWGEQLRPDIARDLKEDLSSHINDFGRGAIQSLCSDDYLRDETGIIKEKVKSLLGIVAATPIVSKQYDPTCMVSSVAGYIKLLTTDMKEDVIVIVQRLIEVADCVDKGIISEIIALGVKCTTADKTDYKLALFVASVSHGMLCLNSEHQKKGEIISDTRTAFAIRAGLIEMSLSLIQSFGEHESVVKHMLSESDSGRVSELLISDYVEKIFRSIHAMLLHQKTNKAIKHKRDSVHEKKLLRLEEVKGNPTLAKLCSELGMPNNGTCAVTAHPKIKELFGMVRSILNINGSYCCRCNKSLSRTEVLQCNGCSSMVYCSRACQKKDWLNGHKLTCSKMCTNDNIGIFQGRLWPTSFPEDERDASKLKELETNFTMVQLKMFLDHSDTILSQVEALGIPLCDCIVVFDLRKCPLTVGTFEYTHKGKFYSSNYCITSGYFESDQEREGFEASRSRENITCSFVSNTFIGDDILDQDGDVVQGIQMQRLFPHEWLTQKANQISDDD